MGALAHPTVTAMMVSPYLKRPVRSLDEVLRAKPGGERSDVVIVRALAEAEAAGQGTRDQISRAVAALRRLYPGLSTRDALAMVRRIRAQG